VAASAVPGAIAALTFDIGFEIVLAAVPFFAIPALLGLIRPSSPEPDPAVVDAG
jgi:hypothetical protein